MWEEDSSFLEPGADVPMETVAEFFAFGNHRHSGLTPAMGDRKAFEPF